MPKRTYAFRKIPTSDCCFPSLSRATNSSYRSSKMIIVISQTIYQLESCREYVVQRLL